MNDRLRQLLGILIGIPICLAIGVSIVILIFHLEGAAQTLAILALVAIGIAAIALYAVRNVRGNKLVEGLLDILYKEANPERFIRESEAALQKTKNRALRNTLSLNLAVGYEAAGRYDEAIAVMKNMNIATADKTSKAMFYCNAAAFYAEKGALSEGQEAYNSGRPFFEKAGQDVSLAYVRLTRGLLYYAEGKYGDALDTFDKARSRGFDDRHSLTKLQLFEARALARLGRIREAKNVYGKIVQKKTYPYLLRCAKEEMTALAQREE